MKHVICIQNRKFKISLMKRKIYQVIADKTAEQKNLFRVKDESGQSYLYPQRFFMTIKLPQPILKAIDKAA